MGSGHHGAGSKGSRPSDSGEDLKSTNEVPGGQLWAKSHFVKGKWGSVQGARLQVLAGPPWSPSPSPRPRDGPGSSTQADSTAQWTWSGYTAVQIWGTDAFLSLRPLPLQALHHVDKRRGSPKWWGPQTQTDPPAVTTGRWSSGLPAHSSPTSGPSQNLWPSLSSGLKSTPCSSKEPIQ